MGYKRDEISFTDVEAACRDGGGQWNSQTKECEGLDPETRSITRQLEGVQNHIQAGRVIVNLLRSSLGRP